MLTRLRVENFKNLRRVEARLEGLNVLIGPNGCGKSSLLQAIDFLRGFVLYDSVQQYLDEREWAYDDLPNLRQAKKLISWDVEAELPGDDRGAPAGTYHYEIALQPRRYLGIGHERLTLHRHGADPVSLLDRKGPHLSLLDSRTGAKQTMRILRQPASVMALLDPRTDAKRYPELFHFRDWVAGYRSFLIWDPKVLRRRDRPQRGEPAPQLGPSGDRLASVLAALRAKRPEAYGKLVRRVRRLFPTVSDIEVQGGRGWGWRRIGLIEGEASNRVAFNSQQISDGVLRMLAVLTLLHAESAPSVLMLEEPENGVHPRLLRDVVGVLRDLSQRKAAPFGCQVIVTTHSAYLLDEFLEHPEQVQVMQRGRPHDGAGIYRLADRADLDLLKETFDRSLGEVWLSGLLDQGRGDESR
jgi:predicted ATPase